MILNVTVIVVSVLGGQYRKELIFNVIVFDVSVWAGNIERN